MELIAKLNLRRALLKISGEVLQGKQPAGIDPGELKRIATDIAAVQDLGIQVCTVIGGGNIFRGGQASGMNRTTADTMGMLATVINGLALGEALESLGREVRVVSAIPMPNVCESFIHRRVERHLEKGRIVIFSAGIGSPFFTSDTAAALRAIEMRCDAIFKGTKFPGVFDQDPAHFPNATRYDTITFHQVLERDLKVMDAAAISLARDNQMPIIVFSIRDKGSFAKVMRGEGERTLITSHIQ
jgi:uridylate kinase